MDEQATKLYTVFVDAGVQHFESDNVTPTSNEQMLNELQERCSSVEFVARDISRGETTLDAVARELESRRDEFDGVVVFGTLADYRPILSGLPTVAVANFPEFSHLPYALLGERGGVLTATCDRANICEPAKSAAMLDELVGKIGVLDGLAKMKRATLLVITDHPYINVRHGDRSIAYAGDLRQKPAEEYNEILRGAVDEALGTRITKIGTPEVAASQAVRDPDEQRVRDISQRWIAEARDMRGTVEQEVMNSAQMYLAMKEMMDEHAATAIATHVRSLTTNPKPEDMVWPSLGNSQLQLDGIVGCCQDHVNVVLTHMLAQYAFGRPSMMGDFMVEPANGVGIVMHCGAPWNPWGGTDRIPYILRDHAERRVPGHGIPGAGACSEVLYPVGQMATVWRIDVPTRSILLHTGETVDGYSLYSDWADMMCRTKLVVELADAEKVQSHLYPDVYGVHRTGTLGDFRDRIKDIGRLLDFDVIEEDRERVAPGIRE